jgi:hypothetical protein
LFSSVGAPISAKTTLCESERRRWSAHCTSTYPAQQFGTGCDSDSATWFLTLVLIRPSRFACETATIYVGGAALLVIRKQSMDFCILSSADGRRRRRRHARQDTICAIISEDFKSFSSVEMPLLRKNGPTQLHRLGGPSRLRPGLTDTDSESPLLRSARRNQRCFAGVRPEATRPSLAFHSRRWAIDYLRE